MHHSNLAEYSWSREDAYYYRNLSLALHPDKNSTDVVSKKLRRSILSDPLLSILGEEGVSIVRSDEMREIPETELNAILQSLRQKINTEKLESDIVLRGALKCVVNATPVTHAITSAIKNEERLDSLSDAGLMSCGLRYSIKKRVRPSTEAGITAHLRQAPYTRIKPAFYGTVNHQFSPRLSSSLRFYLLSPYMSTWNINFTTPEVFLGVQTSILPISLFSRRPAINITIGRRLSPRGLTQGMLQIQMQKRPALSFQIVWPSLNGTDSDDLDENNQSSPPSMFSVKPSAVDGSCGILFQSALPELVGEIGMMFYSLAMRIGSKISIGFHGLSLSLFGKWSGQTAEMSATTTVDHRGLFLHLDISYLQQRFTLPILLSTYDDTWANFFGMIISSTAAALAYYFVLRPRTHAQILRKLNTVREMLKDIAQRQTQAEKIADGLVIQSASYGPRELGSHEGKKLFVDVTVPLQVLVRKSQLYISSGDTKGNIPGFFDPAPSLSKILCIRYIFRGQSHYAEIPDYIPVVLPLAEHRSDADA
ncbi:hypothetical protein BDQ17DRAFT_1361324 [Cyathus striatus]|nr:hypothetical protein BDQ17DRAFT_1361324 [Cyathus striatus]